MIRIKMCYKTINSHTDVILWTKLLASGITWFGLDMHDVQLPYYIREPFMTKDTLSN